MPIGSYFGRKNPAANKLLAMLDDPVIVEALEAYIESNPDLEEGPFLDDQDRLLLGRIAEGSAHSRIDMELVELKLLKIENILTDPEEVPEIDADALEQRAAAFSNALEAYRAHQYPAQGSGRG